MTIAITKITPQMTGTRITSNGVEEEEDELGARVGGLVCTIGLEEGSAVEGEWVTGAWEGRRVRGFADGCVVGCFEGDLEGDLEGALVSP